MKVEQLESGFTRFGSLLIPTRLINHIELEDDILDEWSHPTGKTRVEVSTTDAIYCFYAEDADSIRAFFGYEKEEK